jgi:hypothetical protein
MINHVTVEVGIISDMGVKLMFGGMDSVQK